MKTISLAALVTASFLASGCAVHLPGIRSSHAAVASEKCPPGHQWSDGTCHDKGKGHDPAKHAK